MSQPMKQAHRMVNSNTPTRVYQFGNFRVPKYVVYLTVAFYLSMLALGQVLLTAGGAITPPNAGYYSVLVFGLFIAYCTIIGIATRHE